jgi:phage gpG-like protein
VANKAQVKRLTMQGARALPRIGKGKVTVADLLGGQIHVLPQLDTDDVALRFKEIGGRMEDMQPVLGEWGDYITLRHIPANMATEGKASGRKWQALSPAYARWKRKHFGKLPILVLTGAMKGGFNYTLGKRSMRITNRREYWVYHQYGTRSMPARPLIRLTKNDYKELQAMVVMHLQIERWERE